MEKKKLILDYAKWRCGGHGEYQLGLGDTYLYNSRFDNMCCLGQFSSQINPEVTPEMLEDMGAPDDLPVVVEGLNYQPEYRISEESCTFGPIIQTDLTVAAIQINDDETTTPEEKIALLKELFGQKGYEIEVINYPNVTE